MIFNIIYETDNCRTDTVQIEAESLLECIRKFNDIFGSWVNQVIDWTSN